MDGCGWMWIDDGLMCVDLNGRRRMWIDVDGRGWMCMDMDECG